MFVQIYLEDSVTGVTGYKVRPKLYIPDSLVNYFFPVNFRGSNLNQVLLKVGYLCRCKDGDSSNKMNSKLYTFMMLTKTIPPPGLLFP